MKGIYVIEIFGIRDFNLIAKYIKEGIFWPDAKVDFPFFNPYDNDINLNIDSPIVLIINFGKGEVEYTYPIQFEYIYKKLSNSNKNVKKMYFEEFFKEIKENFAKGNK